MAKPSGCPSVVKITKNGVEYTSKVDIAAYSIQELTRRAMMDVGRYVNYNVRKQVRGAFPFTRAHKNYMRYQMWVPRKENMLVVGMENRKHGAVSAWWADQLELDRFQATHTGGQKKGPRGKNGEPMKYRKRGEGKAARSGEFGSLHAPRRHILEEFVKKNIATIVEIESQYLSYMNEEAAALNAVAATAGKEVNE